MRKLLSVFLVWGWFFAAQSKIGSVTSPEATATTVMGPFKTEAECRASKDELEAFLRSVGEKARVMPCQKRQET